MKRLASHIALGTVIVSCGVAASFAGRPRSQKPPQPGLTVRAAVTEQMATGHAITKGIGAPSVPAAQFLPTTYVETMAGAKGADLALQRELACALSSRDPLPDGRVAHFAWCLDATFTVQGWHAQITDVVATPEETRFSVKLTPRLRSNGLGSVTSLDYHQEHYLYKNGDLTFLGGGRPPDSAEASIIVD